MSISKWTLNTKLMTAMGAVFLLGLGIAVVNLITISRLGSMLAIEHTALKTDAVKELVLSSQRMNTALEKALTAGGYALTG